jgi:hypothetical protein
MADRILTEALQKFGNQIVRQMQNLLARNRANASGYLSNSIEATVTTPQENVTELTISMPAYGEIVDAGRGRSRTGGPKQQWRGDIKQWIQQKGIKLKPGVTLEQAAFLITRKINQKGYRAKPFIQPAIDKVVEQDTEGINNAAFQITINNVDLQLKQFYKKK